MSTLTVGDKNTALVVLLGSPMMVVLTRGTHCTVDRDSSVRAGMNPANSN